MMEKFEMLKVKMISKSVIAELTLRTTCMTVVTVFDVSKCVSECVRST